MLTTNVLPTTANNDAELVRSTLAGDREAFSRIVARYQSLICSLAYSATGSLSQSEDLAQETFMAAWKRLAHLPEPENLRAWLCGIARNLIHNSLRKQGREPSHAAESIESVSESRSPEPLPVEHTISKEEQAILWRSLENIPATYREPLVLFYRENQSVEAVAEKMGLTVDAVHQRLSRGRKLLAEEVAAFVAGALAKTSPGRNFTLAVLAALPLVAASAKAATVGAAVAQGGAAAKGALTVGTLGGLLMMLGGTLVSIKAQADDSKSPRERRFLLRHFGLRFCLAMVLMGGLIALMGLNYFHSPLHASWLAASIGFLAAVQATVVLPRFAQRRRRIQIEDGTFNAAEWTAPRKTTDAATGGSGNRLKMLKFMAGGIGASIYILINQSGEHDIHNAVLWTLLMGFCLVLGIQRWKNRPRFLDFRGMSFYVPIVFWLITLAFFNWHQYLIYFGDATARLISTADAVAFNLVVTAAYVALFAVLARNCRRMSHESNCCGDSEAATSK